MPLSELSDVRLDTRTFFPVVTDTLSNGMPIGTHVGSEMDEARIVLCAGQRLLPLSDGYARSSLMEAKLEHLRSFLRRSGWRDPAEIP